MDWPAAKFEMFYEAHTRRNAARDMNRRRVSTISALLANSNFDGSQSAISEIEESFDRIIRSIYEGADEVDLSKDPLFAAIDMSYVDQEQVDALEREGRKEEFQVAYEVDQE